MYDLGKRLWLQSGKPAGLLHLGTTVSAKRYQVPESLRSSNIWLIPLFFIHLCSANSNQRLKHCIVQLGTFNWMPGVTETQWGTERKEKITTYPKPLSIDKQRLAVLRQMPVTFWYHGILASTEKQQLRVQSSSCDCSYCALASRRRQVTAYLNWLLFASWDWKRKAMHLHLGFCLSQKAVQLIATYCVRPESSCTRAPPCLYFLDAAWPSLSLQAVLKMNTSQGWKWIPHMKLGEASHTTLPVRQYVPRKIPCLRGNRGGRHWF